MIDWVNVAFSSLWVAGLGLLLAAASYYYWLAREEGVPLGTAFRQPPFLRFVLAGLMLVGIGLAGVSSTMAQTILSAVLILLCGYGLVRLLRPPRENRS